MTTTTAKKTTTKKAAAPKKAAASVDNAGLHEYRDQVPLTSLVKHPKNPRHRATADAELVDSVKARGIVQPLIVAPVGNEDTFLLIAGHRRLDAAKKAKRKTVPVVIRRDLVDEAAQVEAMLIENGRRQDLTPIEEAEGYQQLELLGVKAAAIATAVGRDVKTVRSRIRLLKLSASTKKKVHAGGLTLEDAAAMTEFADDPATTKRLEKAAGDGYFFKNELAAARRRRDAARDVAARTAKLLDAGAEQLEAPDNASPWSFPREGGRSPLESTHSTDWGQHKGCLAFVTFDDSYSGPRLYECCTKPETHRAELDAEAQQRADEAEARMKAEEERSLAEAAAADTRVATLMDLARGITVADVLGDLLRTLLPISLRELSGAGLEAYQTAMQIPVEDRWPFLGYHHTKSIELTKFAQHVEDLTSGGNALAARAITAFLAAQGESVVRQHYYLHHNHQTLDYFALLEEAGHHMAPVDEEQRAKHQAAIDEAAAKAEQKAS